MGIEWDPPEGYRGGGLTSVMQTVSSVGLCWALRDLGVDRRVLLGCTTPHPHPGSLCPQGIYGLIPSFVLLSCLGRESSNSSVRLFGRSILLLIIYEGTGQGEVTNSINLSARQLEGCVTNRPGCHLAKDCLSWDHSPRISMMTNVIDIFY